MIVPQAEYEIIQEIKETCAMLLATGGWEQQDAEFIAALLNKADDPWELFRYIDEKTGSSDVGYRTKDGREWFPVLRQMRNTVGSGLLESLR